MALKDPPIKDKSTSVLLAICGGTIGLHKFYLGKPVWGVAYLCFAWTLIPGIAGFIEGLMLTGMTQEKFDRKYNTEALDTRILGLFVDQKKTFKILRKGEQSGTISPEKLAEEAIDRRILRFCQAKKEMTLLDCFLELDDIPKDILELRIDGLLRAEFLHITNRVSDGKVVYRLDL